MRRYAVREVDTSKPEVCHTLMALQAEILPSDFPRSPDLGWWWIVYQGKTPVGFAGMVPSLKWKETVYFCRAGVQLLHRGNGLQRRLINVRMAAAKKLGYKWAVTDTRGNPPSSNNLIACGFKIYEPRAPWGDPKTLYWIRKL